MKQLRILLANQNPILRGTLRVLIERHPGLRVVGEASNGQEAVLLVEFGLPDVLVLDIRLPAKTGLATAREVAVKQPAPAIIFVSMLYNREYVIEAFKGGARGYVTEDTAQSDLVVAIRAVTRGSFFLSSAISSLLIDSLPGDAGQKSVQLTQHEKQIFYFLAEGQSEDDIARSLHCEVATAIAECRRVKNALEADELLAPILKSMKTVSPAPGER
ncbi:MAG TPA: response regulator transcription factor [Bryobacteraceae bacterium]|nr:response regulator transcription factor [Bryobacteraceae bacterium]